MPITTEGVTAFRAVIQVAEKQSFKLAAQTMGLTPSAVAKSIQRLEEQLAVQLFIRSTRSVTITEKGRLFLERCRHVMSELEAAEAELNQGKHSPAGLLKVGLPDASELFTESLFAFTEAFPDIQLDIDFSDRFVDIIGEGFDAVIRTGTPVDSRLKYRKLNNFNWMYVASPEYLQTMNEPTEIQELEHHHCLRQRLSHTGRLAPWFSSADDVFTHAPATLISSKSAFLIELAVRGKGIAMLPSLSVKNQLQQKLLKQVLENTALPGGSVGILWPSAKHSQPKISAFIDFMSVHFHKLNSL
ncbi:LysR substrate-binding domain-containing protein [Kosakonia radicincitans]|uniref:LysR substrate-binding domain-containing protein n=1 Tax=Kosakonia radicincitans TaxID=283686 RepID=UPI00055AB510|nr:LysR substrate-binding domain-containing protein [Kosakonia radicincitans]